MTTQRNALALTLAASFGAVATAGVQKATAPAQVVALRAARFGADGSVRLALAVRQGALGGGVEVVCPATGPAMSGGKPAAAAEPLCKAARALPAAVTADLAALVP
jgi:hypothetical protein